MCEPRTEGETIERARAVIAPTPRPVRQPGRIVVCAASTVLIGLFLTLDFSAPRIPENARLWQAVAIGICAAQMSLIATWAVLAPGNIVVRLPWSFLLVTAMWYALVLGIQNAEAGHFKLEEAFLEGAFLVVGFAGAQVPLWLVKKVFRWRLIHGADDAAQSPTGPWQFRLWHLLLATFLIAVALSLIRKELSSGTIAHSPWDAGELDAGLFVFALSILLAAMLVCTVLITVPCAWGAFHMSRPTIRQALIMGLIWCAVSLVLFSVLGPPNHWEAGAALLLFIVCQGATIFGTLLIYRALGFRLVRAKPATASP